MSVYMITRPPSLVQVVADLHPSAGAQLVKARASAAAVSSSYSSVLMLNA